MTITKESTFVEADRYVFDFSYCSHKQGWSQLDTAQDASYHGQWANPSKRQLVSFCEGDVTVTKCSTTEDFTAEVERIAKFYADDAFRIDPVGNADSWAGLGLDQYLAQ